MAVIGVLRVQFGRRLKLLRKSQGFTQEQLSGATGLSVEFLSNVERGINAPSFETLERLSDALNMPVSHLFSDLE